MRNLSKHSQGLSAHQIKALWGLSHIHALFEIALSFFTNPSSFYTKCLTAELTGLQGFSARPRVPSPYSQSICLTSSPICCINCRNFPSSSPENLILNLGQGGGLRSGGACSFCQQLKPGEPQRSQRELGRKGFFLANSREWLLDTKEETSFSRAFSPWQVFLITTE